MGKCPGSLARRRSHSRAGARAAGPGQVSGHSRHTQIRGAGGNKLPRSAREEVQGLPERRILQSPEKSAVLHFVCLQTSGCATSLREQGISAGLSGQLCLSSPFGQPLSRLSSLGRQTFSSGVAVLVCSTGGHKTRYGLPQLPLVKQYLWVVSKSVHVSKTTKKPCLKVIPCAS